MATSLKDKVIIVTGASSGIGLASARQFGREGARVVMASRSLDKLLALAPSVAEEDRVLCVTCDVTNEEDCRAMVAATVEHFGRIDILVNNAGISMRAMFRDLDLKVLHTLMDVNFWGTVYCTKFALPYLLESRGIVVGVVSIAGYSSLPARTGYGASKYALRGFLDTLRIEHLKDGLRVLDFAPGYTASNVRRSALTADGTAQGITPLDETKLMSAERCAQLLSRALHGSRSSVILSPLGRATVLCHRFFPRLVDRLTYSYVAREPGSPFK